MNEKPEALRLAERIELRDYYEFDAALHCPDVADALRRQHAEIERLKAERDEAVKAEREACAKACEKLIDTFSSSQYKTGQPWSSIGERFAVSSCADAIRARGET
jgi:hypothetical protein